MPQKSIPQKKTAQSLLTLYYFNPEVNSLSRARALLDPRAGKPTDVELDRSSSAQLYLPEPSSNPPPWSRLLLPYSDQIGVMRNTSHSAILLVKVDDYIFAATFGRAQHFLPQDRLVRNFGLRTVVNAVSPESLHSIDMKSFESMALHTRVQASTKSPIRHFGIDWTRDLLRAVTGTPTDLKFAKRLSGADSLVICGNQVLADIPGLCRTALRYYSSDDYQSTQWSFIDFLQPEMDPVIINHLDSAVADAIMHASELNPPHLTIDEILDYAGISHFSILPSRSHKTESLDISQLRNFIRQHDQRTPVEWLREASIKVFFADLPSGAVRHRVYNSIDWSTRYQDRLYVFSSGIWLRVKQEYADQLDACISKIGTPTNKLPLAPTEVMQTQKGVANDNKGEGLYVNAVTANRFSFLKLHPSLLRSELMNEDVEPCDILGADGALYYIKRGGRSSGLSHLFSQGRAAALTLMRDAEYRRLFRGVICKVVDDAAADPDEAEWLKQEYASKFPEEGVDPKTIEVCFVVIRNSSDGWPINMPYLSKVSLYETYRHLSGAKFTVTIQCVTPEAPDPANTPTEQAATDKERADSARAQGAVSP